MKNLTLSETRYDNRSTTPLKVHVTVKNEGNVEAKEVVQLYVHCVEPHLQKPEKELKGFVKVRLFPGEEKEVEMTLLPRDFCFL